MEKNIIILKIDYGHPSGVVRYIQMLSKGLEAYPHIKVHSICLDCCILFPKVEKKDGIISANVPFPYSSESLRKELYWQIRYFKAVAEILAPYFREMTGKIWHVNELLLCNLVDALKSDAGGMICSHLHVIPWKFCLGTDEKLFNKMYSEYLIGIFKTIGQNQLEQKIYNLSDKIICVSEFAKQYIMAAYRINPKKIAVIYNGLTDDILTNTKNVNSEDYFDILFVGRVNKEKGVIGLLNSLKKVKRKGYNFNLKLAGHCSEAMMQKIHSTYRELNVDILGKVALDQLVALYSRCTIGVIPSLHEQCSYVAIEMSMFGIPIVVSDVDALSEMFEDEINALKVPLSFDPDFGLELNEDKLADSIIRLMENKALREQLSQNARENYRNRFTLKQMINNTVDLYKQLVP